MVKQRSDITRFSKKTQFQKDDGRPKGRKPLVLELNAREFILGCINGGVGVDVIVRKVYYQAAKGSFKHQELLLNYILGKPTERIKLENADGKPLPTYSPVVKIIADHLRLEKLTKDAEEVVDKDRIEEAEAILNNAITHSPTVESATPPEDNNIGENKKKK
jgi:hypothetical protein